MRLRSYLVVIGSLLLGGFGVARAQSPYGVIDATRPPTPTAQSTSALTAASVAAQDRQAQQQSLEIQLTTLHQQVAELQKRQLVLQGSEQADVKKQIELLEKQIETQQKMIQLLLEQVKKQPTLLEAQARQTAQRDLELSQAVDNIVEHQDATERYGPAIPSQLKELFLPSGNNETPLTISGALAFGYSKLQNQPGGFYFGELSPDFFVKLNDWILLEAEIGLGSGGDVGATFAQADFIINDWLTVIGGKFVAPIGWYNERMNNPWINKLPGDAPGGAPLPWLQVLPPMQILGVQARGAFYLGCSPLKLEYATYFGNGLNFTPATAGAPTLNELSDLEGMTDTDQNVTGKLAVGGRVGLWYPEKGLEVGMSGMYNGPYVAGGFNDSITIWAIDFNYHKDNWDVRAEYGMTLQQTQSFLPHDIRRQGVLGQIAYRPRDAANHYLRNLELVYRYCYTDFTGIDPTALDLTAFGTSVDVPVRRHQNEFGINYYFYPRMVLKFAYQINTEPSFPLRDNQFITELAWGW